LRRRRWRVPEARAALDALAASGLSVSAFAEREGLDEERLYRWRRRFARERKAEAGAVTPPATPPIIELRAAPTPRPRHAETERVEIVLASGVVLRVAETIDPAGLARLVAALGRGC
jgi:transposase-like protein